jgi:hypothetical protein
VYYEIVVGFVENWNQVVDCIVGYGDFNRGEVDFLAVRGDVKGICQRLDCCEGGI